MTKSIVLFTIAALGILFLGAIVFGLSVMGDRFCKIELQNLRQENISIKTVVSTGNEWTMVVDSVSIVPQGKFELGNCINCTVLKQSDFDFDAIVVFKSKEAPKLIHRKDLSNYLNALKRVDCATFELR